MSFTITFGFLTPRITKVLIALDPIDLDKSDCEILGEFIVVRDWTDSFFLQS